MDASKFIEEGSKLGLTGDRLVEYVSNKEKYFRQREIEQLERDERNAERETKKLEQQNQIILLEKESERAEKEAIHKLSILDKEIELEKAKIETSHSALDASMSASESHGHHVGAKLPKLPMFNDQRDNIDAYLLRFERFAQNAKWPENTWANNLSALLQHKALDVYSRLPPADAQDYKTVKVALLKRFQLTEEGFRNKFRSSKPEQGESPSQFIARLENYLTRWMDLSKTPRTFAGLVDLLLREQFICSAGKSLSMFLRERKPKNKEEMSELAEQYIEAHGVTSFISDKIFTPKQNSNTSQNTSSSVQQNRDLAGRGVSDKGRSDRRCYKCGNIGHVARDCLSTSRQVPGGRNYNTAGMLEQVDYQNCHGRGYSSQGQGRGYLGQGSNRGRGHGRGYDIPYNSSGGDPNTEAQVGSACLVSDELKSCCIQGCQVKLQCGHMLPVIGSVCKGCSNMPVVTGYIEGSKVKVLRDTGCSGVVVKSSLIQGSQLTGNSQRCVLIDGTVRNFKEASINIDTPFYAGNVVALCVDNPVYDLIIGNITGVRNMEDIDPDWEINNTGVSLDDNKVSVSEMTECKIVDQECQAVETRSQKKKSTEFKGMKVVSPIDVGISVDDIKKAQQEDDTLAKYRELTKSGKRKITGSSNVSWFIMKKGLLYRCFQSPKVDDNKIFHQLIVPKQYREVVLKLAHDGIMAGHLGVRKTTDRILSNFYWPGIQSHVTRYCRSCDICQKTFPKGKITKVPLGRMPLIETPFERVAVDLVGPIYPATERGNRYILTLVDYSTRYPEAVPLKGIETERVAEALVEMFTRIGIPKEILSDMGTQFTSNIMKAVGRLLSINQLTTTPYHPACNGLVEKFNGTLKNMLRKMSTERPKDWDRYIPSLLFAYREVPQESLGFSPFELVYGRTVRGPMTILRELWTNEDSEPDVKSTYQYVLDLKDKLTDTCELAKRELVKSSARYKKYFDYRTKRKSFKIGDKVLLLLPTDKNKLLMQWKGPYTVTGRVGVADYRIDKDGKIRTFHANLLKKYIDRNQTGSTVPDVVSCVIINTEPDEMLSDNDPLLNIVPLKATETVDDVKVNDGLSTEQKQEVRKLLDEFSDVLSDLPGRTDVVQHEINLTTEDPIRNKTYQVPYAMRDVVRNEIKQMLQMDIIEPSESSYASSIVIVKKPDGSNRLCLDFRNLNKVTVFDAEPMPDPEEIFAKIGQSCYFTKIDLCKGYWQIPMREQDKDLTSFVTPDGLYRFKVMAFGMINSAATFNRMMRLILRDMVHTDSFVDDILVHTSSWEGHLVEIKELLRRLRSMNLTAKPLKCKVGYQNLDFLGHTVGGGFIGPNEDKLKAISDTPRPETKKQMRSFLGFIGFYRKFIPNFAAVAAPLTDLTKKGVPNRFEWSTEHENAFQNLKKMLMYSPILRLVDFNKQLVLRTDASEYGLGGVLLQDHDGKLYPVAYASRKLSVAERVYSVIEKECLAIIWALQKFQVYLYGRTFILQTDHQPLVYLQKAKVSNGRLMRWALHLQSYNFRIEAIKGSDNVGADFLSRHVQ